MTAYQRTYPDFSIGSWAGRLEIGAHRHRTHFQPLFSTTASLVKAILH